ncbi:hypothetical protein F4779DRAFT_629163 [Xylariaceae sp. FL0662B]|nr:hypothetical protein F4779DRAFT_629163 [Xylariaceae sp. FL0662B]
MKTDYYLNLCLQQAELSPLHYRHGCIVVKGGKVIGKGFNDYRPGYDGGALKTGLLPTKSFSLDNKKKQGNVKAEKTSQKDGFTPFESSVGRLAGGHHHANNSLSMHSEMMAINSALSSSSASAAMTLSHIKPPGATSRDSKRKRQQQRGVINAYAQRVCYDAVGSQAENKKARQQPDTKILEITPKSNNLKDRTKHPKLRGADVYVARLGGVQRSGEPKSRSKKRPVNFAHEAGSKEDFSSSSSSPSTASLASSGSLHDELTCKENKPSPPPKVPMSEGINTVIGHDNVLDSRPCYRCVLYMHSAGIRRVYWTNGEGRWENAKVRDLFDRVSGTAATCDDHDGGSIGLGGVFVTKHEILMLRRLAKQGAM